jgi:DNA-directed RNA polymerase sigma subunit (sigma70/sigma32)
MKIFRDLKVKLTEAEWKAVASAMAAEQAKLAEVEAEKAEAMSTFKARIETHKTKFLELAEKVNSHEERRAVECVERPDYQRWVIELYRNDTGEMVEMRPMTAGERQVTLPGVADEDKDSN